MIPLDILATLYWIVLLAITVGSLVLAALALTKKNLAYFSGGLLVLALVLAAVRFTPAPAGVGVLLSLLCIALAIVGGGPAVNLALGLAGGGSPAGAHGGILVETTEGVSSEPKREVLRGGATIGILERVAVAASIVAGHPEAIAVVVAVKGVGRFTELDASEARERFIIGTMASLIWACASAALARVVLG
ncbi:MAG: hypothetical protein QOK46_1329 [Microbacteriaceae bacterium]|jgi:hypothetical protein|nr:hypothetical protein [Microbacteriaceae bacterium]MDQ1554251.1 hypothetical protein [Microbacteriaceae bacterium]